MRVSIEDWWREERRRKPAPDPGYPMMNADCLGRECPVPWSFVVGVMSQHAWLDWDKTRASLTAALKRKP